MLKVVGAPVQTQDLKAYNNSLMHSAAGPFMIRFKGGNLYITLFLWLWFNKLGRDKLRAHMSINWLGKSSFLKKKKMEKRLL